MLIHNQYGNDDGVVARAVSRSLRPAVTLRRDRPALLRRHISKQWEGHTRLGPLSQHLTKMVAISGSASLHLANRLTPGERSGLAMEAQLMIIQKLLEN